MTDEDILETARTAKLVVDGWLVASPLMTAGFARALVALAEKQGMSLELPADRIHITIKE